MDSQTKIAKERLKILKLAQSIGNVSQACKIGGISRSQFYKYKARYEKYGFEGLKNFSPIHKSHPHTTPLEVEQKIINLSLKHPSYGCNKLKELFCKRTGYTISRVTIQKILNKSNLGTQYNRWFALEEQYFKKKLKNLTNEQIAFIEKNNPAFRERHFEANRPGEIFCMDVIPLYKTLSAIPAYMYIIIDIFSGFSFCCLNNTQNYQLMVTFLNNTILFFNEKYQYFSIPTVLITNRRNLFCEKQNRPLKQYLISSNIKHKVFAGKRKNGFIDRFYKTAINKFFKNIDWKNRNDIFDIQLEFNKWLEKFNYEQPWLGYRNMGQTPHERIIEANTN